MHVFVTGGSGLTGPAVVSELIRAGHTVTGLARSAASAARLDGLGAAVHRGELDDLDSLRRGAAAAEGVLHMGFGGSFADPDDLVRRDRGAIEAMGAELVGSGRPYVVTSGTFVLPAGQISTERDAPDPEALAWFRIPGERACLDLVGQGVRSSVVRLAPTVHGPGDYGFVPMLIAAARRTGVSAYVGDGSNRWPAIHRLDAAVLFRRALESAPAGSALHGTGEAAIALRAVAEKLGQLLELPVRSVAAADAPGHFGDPFMARVFAADVPASSELTQALLGWTPAHPTLLEDLQDGDYIVRG